MPQPDRRSFIEVPPDSHFPIQNLPYGVFRREPGGAPRVGVAIGDQVLDLSVLEEAELFRGLLVGEHVFAAANLNPFIEQGRGTWLTVRARIAELLEPASVLATGESLRDAALVPQRDVELLLPVQIGDYTDFYSSREHATNVGIMFRGAENALMPNWLHLPVAYHGRSSSIVVSGTDIRRPRGQVLPEGSDRPAFSPTRSFDFELELGFFVGAGNELGEPVPVEHAADHIFGFVLVNDWSARDVQRWEYQPLGPFLAKNFATSLSPWVVPLDALLPFRVSGGEQHPEPLPYLRRVGDWTFDIRLEVALQTARMDEPVTISTSNARHLYWDVCQQLAHHTIGGCNLRPGDLLASGTISGPDKGSRGSLLELTWRGTEPIRLPTGEERRFLLDGDRLTITGYAQGDGYRVGFGEVTGRVLPALPGER